MKVLVTGGGGFIGANLCKMLIEQEHSVASYSLMAPGVAFSAQQVDFSACEMLMGDVNDSYKLGEAMRGCDAVVHLAALAGIPLSLLYPSRTWETNVSGTLSVLLRARENDVKRIVFVSSAAAVASASPYGASKAAGEALCRAFVESFGLQAAVVRPSNVYGRFSLHKTSVVSQFIKAALRGKPLLVDGTGEQLRDFVYVDDVCRQIIWLLESESVRNCPYAASTLIHTSINELVGELEKIHDSSDASTPIQVEHNEPPDGERPAEAFLDTTHTELNALDAATPLSVGLTKTYDWFSMQSLSVSKSLADVAQQ